MTVRSPSSRSATLRSCPQTDSLSRRHAGRDGRRCRHRAPSAGRAGGRAGAYQRARLAHEKRYQDVEDLLNAGITVITTLNIQHLEGLNDIVEAITGVRQRETLPDRVLDEADEVELVDIAPDALRARLRHGNVYPQERVATGAGELLLAEQPHRAARTGAAAHRREDRDAT